MFLSYLPWLVASIFGTPLRITDFEIVMGDRV